jgi:hypothetical protein
MFFGLSLGMACLKNLFNSTTHDMAVIKDFFNLPNGKAGLPLSQENFDTNGAVKARYSNGKKRPFSRFPTDLAACQTFRTLPHALSCLPCAWSRRGYFPSS